MSSHPPDVADPGRLRWVLSEVPTSLAVVCAMDGPRPVGATIGSFVSVSLDPPLVAWFAMRPSSTLGVVRRSGSFSVNLLADDQADLCAVFASRAADRFRGVAWRSGPVGDPHLDGALVVLDCDVDTLQVIGDHEMVVGRVTRGTGRRPDAGPLVFSGGGCHGLSPRAGLPWREVARPA